MLNFFTRVAQVYYDRDDPTAVQIADVASPLSAIFTVGSTIRQRETRYERWYSIVAAELASLILLPGGVTQLVGFFT